MFAPAGRYYSLIICIMILSLLGCEKETEVKPPPVEFTDTDSCALCGMLIMEYPGPKAQIHYRNGRVDRFCSVQEMMSFYLQPDRPKDIVAIYVTDMKRADWKRPRNAWIDAEGAFYVYGASISGAMGNELVPFSDRPSAEAFIARYGGKVIRFHEINMQMLEPR